MSGFSWKILSIGGGLPAAKAANTSALMAAARSSGKLFIAFTKRVCGSAAPSGGITVVMMW